MKVRDEPLPHLLRPDRGNDIRQPSKTPPPTQVSNFPATTKLRDTGGRPWSDGIAWHQPDVPP